jgi:hypothetical protein
MPNFLLPEVEWRVEDSQYGTMWVRSGDTTRFLVTGRAFTPPRFVTATTSDQAIAIARRRYGSGVVVYRSTDIP